MKRFYDSLACLSGRHCETCRDLEGGRKWRASIRAAYRVPGDSDEFQCWVGHGWGYRPLRGLGDIVERAIKAVTFGRVKPCSGCKKRRDRLNELVPLRGKG